LAAIAFALSRFLARVVTQRVVRKSVEVPTPPSVTYQIATDALRLLSPKSKLRGQPDRMRVTIELPQTWASFGERVSAEVKPLEGQSVVEVVSNSIRPTFMDHGKNRRNVDAVIELILSSSR